MESKLILVGLIIGILVGGLGGYFGAPSPDVSGLNTQIDVLEAKVSDYESELANLRREISDLSDRLSEKSDDLSELVMEHQNLQSAYNTLKEDYEQRENTVQDYQSQIIELQSKVDLLQQLYNYTSGEWSVLKTWSGSSSKTTEIFYIPSNQARIKWNLITGEYSGFWILLYHEGGEHSTKYWGNLAEQPKDITYAYIEPGNYYIEFEVIDCTYEVKVEVIAP